MESIYLIRHGACRGNLEKRYIGRTDEPLCEAGRLELLRGREAGVYGPVKSVYASPMKRCVQTARLLYPVQEAVTAAGLRECDFGLFEGKNYKELSGEALYREWIGSGGLLPFPGGEAPEEFKRRSAAAMLELLESGPLFPAAFIVHGGTIMAVMERLCTEKRGYYDWHVPNGEGYACEYVRESGRLRLNCDLRLPRAADGREGAL